MNNCTLCQANREKRKLFFPKKNICDTHYIEYLEFIINSTLEEMTEEDFQDKSTEFLLSRELTPSVLAEEEREERERKEQEEEELKKKASQPTPSPYSSPFGMGM
jgi:replicative superfamily II helicase